VKVLQHRIPPRVLLVVGAEFLSALVAFFLSASMVTGGDLRLARELEGALLPQGLTFAFAAILGIATMGLYSTHQRLRVEGIVVRLTVGIALAAVGLAVLAFLIPLVDERVIWLAAVGLSLPLVGGSRMMLQLLMDDELFRRRVLVFGAGKRAASLLELRRRSDQRGFRIVAFVATESDGDRIDDSRVRAYDAPLLTMAHEGLVSEIVVAVDDRRRSFPIRELLECKLSGINIVDVLDFLERESGRVKIDLVNPGWLVFSEGLSKSARRTISSRVFDLLMSITLLIVALPLMLITAAAIFLEDGAPVLFRQARVGFLGEEFTLYKFRSMRKDAEADGQARWAQMNDTRVTRVGCVIRRLRLDELPQLINVIQGDMAFVGPRPERPEFVDQLAETIPYYHERHYVKPGLTGWAQLSYPYGASETDALGKLQFDLYYVKHRSLIFDLMILLQTVEVVLWRKGAR